LRITVEINGQAYEGDVEARTLLSDFIRHTAGLTGTKVGCEQGVCGACTVLLDGEPVRACLVLAVQADGRRVETVEALANGDALHPVQAAFTEHGALQCGFCTPGFVVLSAWLLDREPDADRERVTALLSSNLCRCTGYGPILAATLAAQGKGAA
jgi:aerobic-type carbon monoxide dehydrogenase small subunit (CoxS/CutS family)